MKIIGRVNITGFSATRGQRSVAKNIAAMLLSEINFAQLKYHKYDRNIDQNSSASTPAAPSLL
ncbi:MAG: hypothetical protein R2912_05355 [Eubacteriales bacterium]